MTAVYESPAVLESGRARRGRAAKTNRGFTTVMRRLIHMKWTRPFSSSPPAVFTPN